MSDAGAGRAYLTLDDETNIEVTGMHPAQVDALRAQLVVLVTRAEARGYRAAIDTYNSVQRGLRAVDGER